MAFDIEGFGLPKDCDESEIASYRPSELRAYIEESTGETISDNTVRNFFKHLIPTMLGIGDSKDVDNMMNKEKYDVEHKIPKAIYEDVKTLIIKQINTGSRMKKYIKTGKPEVTFPDLIGDPFYDMGTDVSRKMYLTYIAIRYAHQNFNDALVEKISQAVLDRIDDEYYAAAIRYDVELCNETEWTTTEIPKYKGMLRKKICKYSKAADNEMKGNLKFKKKIDDLNSLKDCYEEFSKLTSFIDRATSSYEAASHLEATAGHVGSDYNTYKNMQKD